MFDAGLAVLGSEARQIPVWPEVQLETQETRIPGDTALESALQSLPLGLCQMVRERMEACRFGRQFRFAAFGVPS